jgi:uracil-DNA glycosylase
MPTEEDVRKGILFSGNSLLQDMLADAGIQQYTCASTAVFLTRPIGGLDAWARQRKDIHPDKARPWAWIPVSPKTYISPAHLQPALERLQSEITALRPNIIVALGATAMAALTGISGIGKVRGTVHLSTLVPGIKVLGTYSPQAVMRQYELRPIVAMDFIKVRLERDTPELNFLRRQLYIKPTIADLSEWTALLSAAPQLAVDIETKARQITCIGFAPSIQTAYVIPFWDRTKPNNHYWHTVEEEVYAWKAVAAILRSPAVKIMQNGMYDVQYCMSYKWRITNFLEDTMLKHHSIYPALPKGLDFLGSLYANERAWKKLRPRGGEEKANS